MYKDRTQRTLLRNLRQRVDLRQFQAAIWLVEALDRLAEEVLVVVEARVGRDLAAVVLMSMG